MCGLQSGCAWRNIEAAPAKQAAILSLSATQSPCTSSGICRASFAR